MKTMTFRVLTTVYALSLTTLAIAGGVAGGGGPPAKDELRDFLQSNDNRAMLFEIDQDQVALGVDAELTPEMLVSRDAKHPEAIPMAAEDFDRMAEIPQDIQAMNLNGEIRSYHVEKTQEADTLRLVDPK